jgi:hypothetical protein
LVIVVLLWFMPYFDALISSINFLGQNMYILW